MSTTISPDAVLIEMSDLHQVGAALCCRFGDATAEAYRLTTLQDVLDSSRSLARALEEFARAGSAHHRGVHCTADMRVELERLTRSLSTWSDALNSAALINREWQAGSDCIKSVMRDLGLAGASGMLDMGDTPTATAQPA
jgi:hypothetical protein